MPYSVLAYHLTDNLKLKKFSTVFPDTPQDATAQRIIYQLSEDSYCLVYNFGSVVFFNVDEKRRENYLAQIKSILDQEIILVTSDDFLVEVDSQKPRSIDFTQLTVKKLTKPIVELVSLILAQSTALEYFENEVTALLNQLETMSASASRKRTFGISSK